AVWAARLGRAGQHALALPVPVDRVRLRSAREQAVAVLSAVPGTAVTAADQVARDVVGEDLDGVRVRQLVLIHHHGVAHLQLHDAHPTGLDAADPHVAAHGPDLVGAVDRALEQLEDPLRVAVDTAAATGLDHVTAHGEVVHDDAQRLVGPQVQAHGGMHGQRRLALVRVIQAGEVGRVAAHQQ